MTEDEGIQTPTKLGLHISPARVYLTLLNLKKASGKKISGYSKIARQEVYRVLAELLEKGLVEKIIAMPTEFKPIPLKEGISNLIERRKKELSETEKEAIKLVQKLNKENSKTTLQENETRFSLFPEKAAVRREERTLVTVQKSLDVTTSCENPHGIIFIDEEAITKALQRGVRIRVIIDKPAEGKLLSAVTNKLQKYPGFKIRFLPAEPNALISIYDKKEAWVCTGIGPTLEESPTLWTNNPCLLSILQDYFEMVWHRAMENKINGLRR
jgi:sugar-specific transcriptional regulator TrmB